VQDRNYPALSKWLAANVLLGGVRSFTKYGLLAYGAVKTAGYLTGLAEKKHVAGDLPLELYLALKRTFGEKVADSMMWGLPAMAAFDMSYSVQLIDTPFADSVAEAIGEVALGPTGQLVARIGAAGLSDEGPLPIGSLRRMAKQAVRDVPVFRFVDGMRKLAQKNEDGTYDFETPGGRLLFQEDLRGVLLYLNGFRTVDRGKQDLIISAVEAMNQEYSAALTRVSQNLIAAGAAATDEEAEKYRLRGIAEATSWNEQNPEFPIDSQAIKARVRGRLRSAEQGTVGRFFQNAPKRFRVKQREWMEELGLEDVEEPVEEEEP